jgi:hypothetical protein
MITEIAMETGSPVILLLVPIAPNWRCFYTHILDGFSHCGMVLGIKDFHLVNALSQIGNSRYQRGIPFLIGVVPGLDEVDKNQHDNDYCAG